MCEENIECAGVWNLNGDTSMPESETEKGYLHKKMSMEMKRRRPQEVWTDRQLMYSCKGGGPGMLYNSILKFGPPLSKRLFVWTVHQSDDLQKP